MSLLRLGFSQKITLLASLLALLSLTTVVTAVTVLVEKHSRAAATELLQETASTNALTAKSQINMAIAKVESMAQMIEGAQQQGMHDRGAMRAMVRSFTAGNKDYLGAYAAWEPNALDGRDTEMQGAPETNPQGRAMFYYYFDDAGTLTYEPFNEFDETDADYYSIPKASNHTELIEPYAETTDGVTRLMTSVVTPLHTAENKFIGIVGIDILLNDMQKQVGALAPFGVGHAALITSAGKWLASPDPALLMQDVGEPYASLMRQASTGQIAQALITINGEKSYAVALPIRFNDVAAPWVFLVTVPEAAVLTEAHAIRTTIIEIALGVMLLTIFAIGFSSSRMVRVIGQLTAVMKRMASGDLSVSVPGDQRSDEIGDMARAVEVFQQQGREREQLQREQASEHDEQRARTRKFEQLVDTFQHQVTDIVTAVSSAATQLEANAQSMSGLAASTLTQANEVASAAGQARQNVDLVAHAASDLENSIHTVDSQMSESITIAGDAVRQVGVATDDISSMAEAVGKVNEIVGLISEIANQTNLLALNATIEAARAGEAGKGFAVVASEVKHLASQTAQATEDITTRINAIHSKSDSVVTAIAAVAETINRLNSTANSARAALEEQKQTTSGIGRSVATASTSTLTVSQSITEVIDASGRTSGASSEVLAAASSLSEQGASLQQTVESFISGVRSA